MKLINFGLASITLGALWYFNYSLGSIGWLVFGVLLFLGIYAETGSLNVTVAHFYWRLARSKFLAILIGTILSEFLESKLKSDPVKVEDLIVALIVSLILALVIHVTEKCFPEPKT